MEYKIALSIAYPSINIPQDFNDLKNQIDEAIEKFNLRFIGRKKLILDQIKGKVILITLEADSELKNPTMELSAFSQILVRYFDFKKYSQKETRLFDAKIISSTDMGRAVETASAAKSDDPFIAIGNMIFDCKTIEDLNAIENELAKLGGIAEYKRKSLNN